MAVSKKGLFFPITILFLFLSLILCLDTVSGEEKTDKKEIKEIKKQETNQPGKTQPPEALERETIEKLPKGRDFTSILPLLPGINYESMLKGLSIDGASSLENRYYIDGVDTTALYGGESGLRVNLDFIESITVPTGLISAEYTGSTGGVVQVVTREGGNTFHGALSLYYDGSALNGKPRPTLRREPVNYDIAEYVTYPEDKWSGIEPGFTLGGPIIKDKLWFFAGFMSKFQKTTRDGDNWPLPGNTIFGDNTHISGSNRFKRKDTYYAGTLKITGQPDKNLRFSVNALLDYHKWDGELPPVDGSGFITLDYSALGAKHPAFSLGGTVDYTVTPDLLLHLSAGYYRGNETESLWMDGPRYTHFGSSIGGYSDYYRVEKNIRTRLTSDFDLSYFFKLLGEHQVKAGVRVTRTGIDKRDCYPYDYYRFMWDRNYTMSDGTIIPTTLGYVEVREPYGVVAENISSTGFAVFFQDNWTIGDKLTLTLGLRAETEDIPAFAGGFDPPIQWGFGDKLAPRLGFSYDVFGDAGLTVFGSFGVYYDTMKMDMAESAYGGFKWVSHYYDIVNPDWEHAYPETDHPQEGGLAGGQYFESRNWYPGFHGITETQPGIKPFQKNEFTFGVRKIFNETWTLETRFLHNYIVNAVEDLNVVLFGDFFIANPGSDWVQSEFNDGVAAGVYPEGIKMSKAVREYTSVTLSLDRKFKNNWLGGFSYTWSRLYGNYSGLASSDEAGRKSPNQLRIFDFWFSTYNQYGEEDLGLLRTDRTHRFKFYGAYAFDFGLTVGFNAYAVSGVPLQTEMYLNGLQGFYPLGRGSAGRSPWLWQLDLYAEYNLKLSETLTLQFNANIFNLTDNDMARNVYALYNDGVVYLDDWDIKNGFDFAQVIANKGAHLDPRYGMEYDYLEALAARLGVKLMF